MLSEFSSLGENQGKSCLAQEEKCTTPCVFPCTSDHGYFTNCQLRRCLERCVGYRRHDFHLPKVKATRNSGSEVPRAQRTCRQESGGLPVTVCSHYNFYFKRQYIHILNTGHSTLLQQKKKSIPSSFTSHEASRLGKPCTTNEDSCQKGWAAGSEWHCNTAARFSCQRDVVLMGWRTRFFFSIVNFQNHSLYPVECARSQSHFRCQPLTSWQRLSKLGLSYGITQATYL